MNQGEWIWTFFLPLIFSISLRKPFNFLNLLLSADEHSPKLKLRGTLYSFLCGSI